MQARDIGVSLPVQLPGLVTGNAAGDRRAARFTQIPNALADGGDKTKAIALRMPASSDYPLPTSQ